MHIVLKTVSGKKHEIDVEESNTVKDMKAKMEGEYDIHSLKLCYKGTILEDSKTVAECKLADNDTIIISGKKRAIVKMVANKPTPKVQSEQTSENVSTVNESRDASVKINEQTAPESTTSPPAPTPAPVEASSIDNPKEKSHQEPESQPPSNAPVPAPVPAAAAASSSTSVESSVSSSLIDEIVAMGFDDRTQVAMALRAAYMNPDRAIEYLCTGIPDHVLREMQPIPVPSPQQQQQHTSVGNVSSSSVQPAEGVVEESLSNNQSTSIPHSNTSTSASVTNSNSGGGSELRRLLHGMREFEQLRYVFQQNPDSIEDAILRIQVAYPHIYEAINANPEEFLNIISEPAPPGAVPFNPSTTSQGSSSIPSNSPIVLTPENTDLVLAQIERQFPPLTEADRASIGELVVLGGGLWDERAAKLVYRVTRGNLEFAGSILFETGGNVGEILRLIQAMQAEAAVAHNAHAGQAGEEEEYDDHE